jgi:hypothetical protein
VHVRIKPCVPKHGGDWLDTDAILLRIDASSDGDPSAEHADVGSRIKERIHLLETRASPLYANAEHWD